MEVVSWDGVSDLARRGRFVVIREPDDLLYPLIEVCASEPWLPNSHLRRDSELSVDVAAAPLLPNMELREESSISYTEGL